LLFFANACFSFRRFLVVSFRSHLSLVLAPLQVARAGYIEMLTHGLCMTRENFDNLSRPNDDTAVQLLNPANEEYEVVRTSLLPGLLKCLNHNKSMPKKNGKKPPAVFFFL
jgi:hypothetical protein